DTVPHKWLDDVEEDAEDNSIPNGPTSARKAAAAAAAAAAALLPHTAGGGGGNQSWGALSRSADLSLTDAHALDFLGSDAAHGGGGGMGSTRRCGNGGVPPKKRQRSIMGGGSSGQAGGSGGMAAAPARGGSGRVRGETRPGSAMGGGGGCDMALLLQAVESELTGGLEEGGAGKGGVEPLLPSSGTGEDAEVAAEEEMASVQGGTGVQLQGSAAALHTQHAQHTHVHPRAGRGAARRQQVALQREQQAAAAAAQLQQQQAWDESPHQQPQQHSRYAPHSAAAAAQRQQQQHAEEQQQGDAGSWSRCYHHQHQHHSQDGALNHARPPEPRSRLSIIEEAVGIRISSFALPLFHNQQPPQRHAPVPLDIPSPADHHPQPLLQQRHSLSSTPSASAPYEPPPAPIPVPTSSHGPSHNASAGAIDNSSSRSTPLQPSLGGPAAALHALGASEEGTLQQQQQQLPQRKPTWRPMPPSPALSAALSVLVSSPTLASLSSMPGVLAKAGNVNLFQAGPGAGKGAGSSQQQLTQSLSGLGHTYMPHWVPGLGVPMMHTTPHFAQN
ncbi:hypothetical protein DUNSADRAFT_5266, partial [Dunaliella salina]